jgi:hypothetical protein
MLSWARRLRGTRPDHRPAPPDGVRHDDSEHELGVFVFAGYSFERRIEYRDKDGTGTSR